MSSERGTIRPCDVDPTGWCRAHLMRCTSVPNPEEPGREPSAP